MRFLVQRRRAGHTTTVTIGGEHGGSGAGLLDSYATALSVGLAYQVPLADLLRSGLDLHFTPSGHTDDPEIPRVRSVADYLARRLAIDWLPYPERAALGIYTLTERVTLAGTWMKTRDPAMCWEMAASVGG
jgi:ribonucleoside-diphosphate reductase alpha chain